MKDVEDGAAARKEEKEEALREGLCK